MCASSGIMCLLTFDLIKWIHGTENYEHESQYLWTDLFPFTLHYSLRENKKHKFHQTFIQLLTFMMQAWKRWRLHFNGIRTQYASYWISKFERYDRRVNGCKITHQQKTRNDRTMQQIFSVHQEKSMKINKVSQPHNVRCSCNVRVRVREHLQRYTLKSKAIHSRTSYFYCVSSSFFSINFIVFFSVSYPPTIQSERRQQPENVKKRQKLIGGTQNEIIDDMLIFLCR